jgi:DNA-directed RNA polymerase specialized sigma24 family protein
MVAVTVGAAIDAERFDSRYAALFGDLVALARALGAGSDAEDVAQDALIQARSHLHQLREPEKLQAWARRIAIRGACRSRRRQMESLGDELVQRLPVSELPGLDVAEAIARLPERERLAVTLVFGMGYRQDEAAELMGVAAGTVYSSIWRARRKLAHLLADDDRASAPTGRSLR